MSSIDTNIPGIIELPQFLDPRGNLAIIEQCDTIPFAIKRVHWIYDVPGGGEREGHAFKTNRELIVALSGSFDVRVKDGYGEKTYHLNRAYKGLYIPQMTWRELDEFSTNSVAVIISSSAYNESDYISDFTEYKKLIDEKDGI